MSCAPLREIFTRATVVTFFITPVSRTKGTSVPTNQGIENRYTPTHCNITYPMWQNPPESTLENIVTFSPVAFAIMRAAA
jgi:hypothetical protein